MWWWVWGALVAATLVFEILLGRDLWRRAVRLWRQLGTAGQTFGDASARLTAAVEEAQARAAAEAGGPSMFDDVVTLRGRVLEQRQERAARAAARRERQWATARGWSLDAWLADRTQARARARAQTAWDGRPASTRDRVGSAASAEVARRVPRREKRPHVP